MLRSGMLWLDDDKRRTLEDKVRRAAAYYREKYGEAPQLCLVNEAQLGDAVQVDNIEVRPAGNVLPSHLWMGCDLQPA